MKKNRIIIVAAIIVLALVLSVGLVGCKLNLGSPLNVKYDGTTLSWDGVSLADYYVVQFNDGEEQEVHNTSIIYDAGGQAFSCKVVAIPEGSGKVLKANTTTCEFKPLDTIAKVEVSDDGVLSWAAVENANAYVVNIDGNAQTSTTATTYNKLPVGKQMIIQVRPIVADDDSYYSLWSPNRTVRILEVPQNIVYDNSTISWDSVANAAGYSVITNSEAQRGTTTSSIVYNANNTDFDCSVKAVGNHVNTFDSALSDSKKFIYLQTVTNVTVSDGKLIWDAVTNATGYEVKTVLNSDTTINEVTNPVLDNLPAGVNMSISIKPVSSDTTYFSDYSAATVVEFLYSPVLDWDAGVMPDSGAYRNVVWNIINQATGYSVKVLKPDGSEEITAIGGTTETSPSFLYDFAAVGTYEVSVKAMIAEGTGVYDSAYSTPITVVRLPAPKAVQNDFIVSDPTSLAKGFTVTFESVSSASQYKMYKDDGKDANAVLSTRTQITVTDGIVDATQAESYVCEYHIISIGQVKTVDGRIIAALDTRTADALTLSITVNAKPTNAFMDGYDLKWDSVAEMYGYVVTSGGSDTHEALTNSYDMSYLNAGNYNVAVCSKGNGGSVLASNYTSPIVLTRLSAPTNVRINTQQNEGTLTFTKITDDAADYISYKVMFGDDAEVFSTDTVGNVNSHILTQGTTVFIWAESNKYNDAGSIYYMSSRASDSETLYFRLEAPTISADPFSNTVFSWNAPSNANANGAYSPSYKVASNPTTNTYYTGIEYSGNSMSIATFSAGTYNFYVKALGDGVKYVDSAFSEGATVTKLATPSVSVVNNRYVWNSVSRAVGYTATVDGVSVSNNIGQSGTTYSFAPNFTKLGYASVIVTAIGDGINTIDSASYQITQYVAKLSTPTFTFSYVDADGNAIASYDKDAFIRFTSSAVDCAVGYSFYVGSSVQSSASNVYEFAATNLVGTYSLKVAARGVGFSADGTVAYIDSDKSDAQSITVLTAPSASSFGYSLGDSQIFWNSVSGNNGYEYQISYNGGSTYTAITATENAFIDVDSTQASIKVLVRTVGYPVANVIGSAWQTYIAK